MSSSYTSFDEWSEAWISEQPSRTHFSAEDWARAAWEAGKASVVLRAIITPVMVRPRHLDATASTDPTHGKISRETHDV